MTLYFQLGGHWATGSNFLLKNTVLSGRLTSVLIKNSKYCLACLEYPGYTKKWRKRRFYFKIRYELRLFLTCVYKGHPSPLDI